MTQSKRLDRPGGPGYPLAAIVGQEQMKLALLLLGVDLGLGGVLLKGEKGTAKSTAARALAELLPPIAVVAGCPQGCDPQGPLCPRCEQLSPPLPVIQRPSPFVDLPLGASEDRVAGSLDLEAAMQRGRLEFSPGLLARAHRGVLYIDEVNLLPAHIGQLVLDAAASGLAVVEREGISHQHPARLALVASYNPEEGPLGPQLTDRFGLCVQVRGESQPTLRQEVIRRRLAFEADPAAFAARWAPAQQDLARSLAQARGHLAATGLTAQAQAEAAQLAAQAGCQGQRGELAMARAARALAAWQGLPTAGPGLVREVAPLALVHRAAEPTSGERVVVQRRLKSPLPSQARPAPQQAASTQTQALGAGQGPSGGAEQVLRVLAPAAVKPVATRLPAREGTSARQAGRRAARQVNQNRGRYVRASSQRLGRSLALDATLRAAAPHQADRRHAGGPALVVRPPDIREKVRAARRGRLLLFLVDASGSMNAAARMSETKAAVLGLLMEAYQKRDRVGLVAFGGAGARELLPPTASVEVARRMLSALPTGGKTPLAHGLVVLAQVLSRELAQDPRLTPLVVILSDGRPNVPLNTAQAQRRVSIQGGWGDAGYADREVLELAQRLAQDGRPRFVVVDTDTGHFQELNLCRPLAQYLGAPCTTLRHITARQVVDLVRAHW